MYWNFSCQHKLKRCTPALWLVLFLSLGNSTWAKSAWVKSTIIIGIYLDYNDSITHAQAKDLVYSKIEMPWAEIEALVLQKAEVLILIPFYCQFLQCQAYRVSHSKEGKVFLLWWGYRFWFLLVFFILHVHELGAFMPNSPVFIFLMLRALYGSISQDLMFHTKFWAILTFRGLFQVIKSNRPSKMYIFTLN